MKEDDRLARVQILIQHKKFAEAERLLKNLLAEDANNADFLALLAEVNLQQEKYEEANELINRAIGLSPDAPDFFYIKAHINILQENFNEAEKNINQAIELYPYNADYHALLANIKLIRKQFAEALEIANRALEIDAENLLALNTRSTALNKLDRKEESFKTIEGALREDPNNAFTHANYGWGLLEKGNHKKALEHFKEALKNDPTSQYAQAGMIEALKAANPIYRMFLKYSFWINNLTAKYQWGFIIGFYFGFRFLRSVANSSPALQPFLAPLIILLAVFAFSTWVIEPISNLFLRFNKYGQMLLSKEKKMSSNFVAVSFGVFAIGTLLLFALPDERFVTVAVFGFAMMPIFSVMFSPSTRKNALIIYAIAMTIVGSLSIAITFLTGEIVNEIGSLFILGFFCFQWVANFILIKEGNP